MKVVSGLGERFMLQSSGDLRNWTNLAALTNINGALEFTDGTSVAQAKRFFRLQRTP
jgi:hypothetical protein